MNVHIANTEIGWLVTDLDAKKSKFFEHYPTTKEIVEFVEENKK